MPLFGLQAYVGNYQKITNTNAAANNPPVYNKNHSLSSHKNKDKYNEDLLLKAVSI